MLMLSTPGQNNCNYFSVNKVQACAHLLGELLVTIVYGRTELHAVVSNGKGVTGRLSVLLLETLFWKRRVQFFEQFAGTFTIWISHLTRTKKMIMTIKILYWWNVLALQSLRQHILLVAFMVLTKKFTLTKFRKLMMMML